MKRIIVATMVVLLTAPLAQAQNPEGVDFLDCSGGCTVTGYGFGNDDVPPGGVTFDVSTLEGTFGIGGALNRGGSGVCGSRGYFPFAGRTDIAEMDSCVVSSTNTCMVEIPDVGARNGNFNVNRSFGPTGASGFFAASAGLFITLQGNVGLRQLNGRCVDGAGNEVFRACATNADCNQLQREICGTNGFCQDNIVDQTTRANAYTLCALDSECGAGESCRAHCMISDANCASDADCPGAGDACGTEIDWDPVGRCEDDPNTPVVESDTLCTRANCYDANGNPDPANCECGAGQCFDGFQLANDLASCVCCDSTGDTFCAAVGFEEYPALQCPFPSPNPIRRDASDWEFMGGAGTPLRTQPMVVPGMEEGHCANNDQRSCGNRGDLFAGADNAKCASGNGLRCADTGGICTTDADCPGGFNDVCESPCIDAENPVNLGIASPCDDVAFGGIAGDFCNFAELGWRNFSGTQTLLDGRPDPANCTTSFTTLRAFPGEKCALPIDIPDNDPQPGCLLRNFGVDRRPDIDCNDIDDATEGRCAPNGVDPCTTDADCPASGNCVNNGDLCPFDGELAPWADANNDDIGDGCQCGDANADGAVTGLDIGAIALCANGVNFCDSTQVDANGDNATSAIDIGGIVSAVNGVIATADLICLRNSPPPTP